MSKYNKCSVSYRYLVIIFINFFWAIYFYYHKVKAMKKILFLFASLISFSAIAQNSNPYPSAQFGQMLNLSNTHKNSANDTLYTGTLYNTTCQRVAGFPAIAPVTGGGPITFTYSALHASTVTTVNPVITATLQSSSDGTRWATVPGVAVLTVTATSATVPVVSKIGILGNYDAYYRFKSTVASDTVSVFTSFFINHSATK